MAELACHAARICWNSKDWVQPTGEAARVESSTYVADMGFGHEEWLFNYEWVLGGWKYGFLQPVNRSLMKLQGRTLSVRLYTIRPDAQWFYVGEIRQCEVLTEDVAAAARSEFKRRGWFRNMRAHVHQVGGNDEGLKYDRATLLFNIRFRPHDAALYDPMVPVGAADGIRALRRYTLTRLDDGLAHVKKEWATRVGTSERRAVGKRSRSAVSHGELDLVHGELQNELFELMVARYGRGAVVMEENFADLKVRRAGQVTLVEIKSDSRPRRALREAIGQLLEYAYVSQSEGERASDLVVVGPGELGTRDAAYLQHLRADRGLPIRYICFRRGMKEVDL